MRRLAILLGVLAGCAFQPAGGASDAGEVDGATVEHDAAGSVDATDAPPQPVAPAWESDMRAASRDEFYTRVLREGAVELGAAEGTADDGEVARLMFRGVPGFGTDDRVGPAYASELATVRDDFHHGIYRMRVRLAACAAGEEVVNGLFTYANDGTDHDGDGLVDNSEIDLEILCGTPSVLFMSVWTEYSDDEGFRKWTRAVDLANGAVWESPSDHEHGLVFVGYEPALVWPDLLAPAHFVELGFEWRADRVRYFIATPDGDRTLAELTGAARVPQLPGRLMFNVWHPGEHWFGSGQAPDFPAADATMLVDWARYWR